MIRLWYIRIMTKSTDETWDNTEITLWSVVELNCGILCASLQTLRPLLAKCIPGLASLGHSNNCHVLYHDGSDKVLVESCV